MTKPKLLDQVRNMIRYKHHSIRKEEAYVDWIKRNIYFHGKRHPAEMGEHEVRQFLIHLAVYGRVASSTQNQAISAILFLYREIMKKDFGALQNLTRHKKPTKLPVVFTNEELKSVL